MASKIIALRAPLDTCPRCASRFVVRHFVVCGRCLTDVHLINTGKAPAYFCSKGFSRQNILFID